MKTEKYIVAFIDIIGFKDMIEQYDNGKQPNLLHNISIIVNSVLNYLRNKPEYQTKEFIEWREKLVVKSFSDCFCIAIPFEYQALEFNTHIRLFYQHIALFQTVFFQNKFLVRGGISIGSFFHDNNIIFSGALVKAYELESKRAKYPRILLSESFLKEISNLKSDYKEKMFVTELSDTFINPFNFTVVDSKEANEQKRLIEVSLPGSGMIWGDFEESAQKEKVKIIDDVKNKMTNYIQQSNINSDVIEKYKWLIEFCEFQLDNTIERFQPYK